MVKMKRLIDRHRYGVFFFAGLLIRMLLNMPYGAARMDDPFTYLFYLVDYHTAGFVPRALVGSVYALFFPKLRLGLVYALAVAVTLLLILAASLLVDRVFQREFEGKTALFLIVCTFLLLSNESYYLFDSFHLGIIDVYFILLTLLIVRLAEHKALRWGIPALCFACMAIYEAYVFAFMAAVGIVLLYVCFKEKSVSAWAVFVLSCLVVIAAFVYFYVLYRPDHLNMLRYDTAEAFVEALRQRGEDMEIPWMTSQLYYSTSSMTFFFDGRWNLADVFKDTDFIRKSCLPTALIFCAMPFCVWYCARKNTREKPQKMLWLLCMLAPLTAAPFLLLSEQEKYISYIVISQLLLLLYFAGREPVVQKPLARAETRLSQTPFLVCLPWGLMIFFRSIW